MENTIYSLFQETVKKNRSNVAIIENKRTMTLYGLGGAVVHDCLCGSVRKGFQGFSHQKRIGFADMEDYMKLGDKEYAD